MIKLRFFIAYISIPLIFFATSCWQKEPYSSSKDEGAKKEAKLSRFDQARKDFKKSTKRVAGIRNRYNIERESGDKYFIVPRHYESIYRVS